MAADQSDLESCGEAVHLSEEAEKPTHTVHGHLDL